MLLCVMLLPLIFLSRNRSSKSQTTPNHLLTIQSTELHYNRTDERFSACWQLNSYIYRTEQETVYLLSQTKSKGKIFILAEQRHFELGFLARNSNLLSRLLIFVSKGTSLAFFDIFSPFPPCLCVFVISCSRYNFSKKASP
jgi:hypothetical protein